MLVITVGKKPYLKFTYPGSRYSLYFLKRIIWSQPQPGECSNVTTPRLEASASTPSFESIRGNLKGGGLYIFIIYFDKALTRII